MGNIYNKMGIEELNQKMCDLQNQLIEYSLKMEEIWVYHPNNPQFKNPITEYKTLQKIVDTIENEIDDLDLRISTIESTN
jgi:hypothetical protein